MKYDTYIYDIGHIWYDAHLKTENQAIQIFHSYLCKPLFVRFAVDVGLVGGLAGDRQVAVLASDWRGLSMIQVDQAWCS